MVSKLHKIAAGLAMVIGLMAVIAGGRVLLGNLPDYYVINWLPVYNFLVGILTVLVSAILIWRKHPFAMQISVATTGLHAIVMLILQTMYRDVVAMDSIAAMTVRLVVWIIILALLIIQQLKTKLSEVEDET